MKHCLAIGCVILFAFPPAAEVSAQSLLSEPDTTLICQRHGRVRPITRVNPDRAHIEIGIYESRGAVSFLMRDRSSAEFNTEGDFVASYSRDEVTFSEERYTYPLDRNYIVPFAMTVSRIDLTYELTSSPGSEYERVEAGLCDIYVPPTPRF